MGSWQAGRGSVTLWAMILGPEIHVGVTLANKIYLNIVPDQVRSFDIS